MVKLKVKKEQILQKTQKHNDEKNPENVNTDNNTNIENE